jgi:hypothetical protein
MRRQKVRGSPARKQDFWTTPKNKHPEGLKLSSGLKNIQTSRA